MFGLKTASFLVTLLSLVGIGVTVSGRPMSPTSSSTHACCHGDSGCCSGDHACCSPAANCCVADAGHCDKCSEECCPPGGCPSTGCCHKVDGSPCGAPSDSTGCCPAEAPCCSGEACDAEGEGCDHSDCVSEQSAK